MQHPGDFSERGGRTGKMVQNEIDADEIRFSVAQGQVVEFAYAQGNAVHVVAETTAGQLQHARGIVHADEFAAGTAQMLQHLARAAAEIGRYAAVFRYGVQNHVGQGKVPENLPVHFVPVVGDFVEELPCFKRSFLNDAGSHVEIGAAGFVVLREGNDAAQKIVPRPFRFGGIEDPQAVAPRMQQARFREYLEVPRYARLPHVEKRNQLVDGQLIVEKNQRQTQARFIRKGFEIPKSLHNLLKCNKYQVLSM